MLVGLFVWRCAVVRNPVLDLHLFENRNFSWANTATLVFMVGFNAMFLGNVLFLTRVWGYSILTAGLAISVGPIIVAVTAPFLGKLAGRIGQRALLVPGGIVWAVGGLWLLRTVGTQPDYAAEYLPSVALTGLGVSLCLPQLSSAAVQGLPADRFGSGSAVNQAVRNLGATLGVALVVAFTADATSLTALDAFREVWWLLVLCGLGTSLLAAFLRTAPADRPTEPVAAQDPAGIAEPLAVRALGADLQP